MNVAVAQKEHRAELLQFTFAHEMIFFFKSQVEGHDARAQNEIGRTWVLL